MLGTGPNRPDHLAHPRRQDRDHQAGRQEGQRRRHRRPPSQALQVLGEQELERDVGAEEGQGAQQRPPPADLGQQAGQHQAEREAAGPERRVDADGPVAHRALREVRGQQGQPGRRGDRGGDALDEPRGDQQSRPADDPAEQGSPREQRQRHQEDAAPAQQVRRAPAEQQQAAVPEHVGADDPLQRGGGEVQVGADDRESDADHGHVQRVQEQRAAQHEQDGPLPGAPRPARGRAERRAHQPARGLPRRLAGGWADGPVCGGPDGGGRDGGGRGILKG